MRYRRRGMRRRVRRSILCAREICMVLKWDIENFNATGGRDLFFEVFHPCHSEPAYAEAAPHRHKSQMGKLIYKILRSILYMT